MVNLSRRRSLAASLISSVISTTSVMKDWFVRKVCIVYAAVSVQPPPPPKPPPTHFFQCLPMWRLLWTSKKRGRNTNICFGQGLMNIYSKVLSFGTYQNSISEKIGKLTLCREVEIRYKRNLLKKKDRGGLTNPCLNVNIIVNICDRLLRQMIKESKKMLFRNYKQVLFPS